VSISIVERHSLGVDMTDSTIFKQIRKQVGELEGKPAVLWGVELGPAPRTAWDEYKESGLSWDEWCVRQEEEGR